MREIGGRNDDRFGAASPSARLGRGFFSSINETVSIKVHTPETRRLQGTLVDAGSEHCTVEVDGQREEIAYADITQARTTFEWGPQPRPGQKKSSDQKKLSEKKSVKKQSQKNKATASKGVTA